MVSKTTQNELQFICELISIFGIGLEGTTFGSYLLKTYVNILIAFKDESMKTTIMTT